MPLAENVSATSLGLRPGLTQRCGAETLILGQNMLGGARNDRKDADAGRS